MERKGLSTTMGWLRTVDRQQRRDSTSMVLGGGEELNSLIEGTNWLYRTKSGMEHVLTVG